VGNILSEAENVGVAQMIESENATSTASAQNHATKLKPAQKAPNLPIAQINS
jgi:hypothetical protein